VPSERETSMHYISCSGGTSAISKKMGWDKLRRNCVFAFDSMGGSHSAFRCIWGAKRRCTIFHARVGPVHIPQKAYQDMLRQTCVLHSVRYVGHVVLCGVSRA
jgi:hypothetical protein